MRNQEWDAAPAQLYPLDLAQFVFCFVGGDAVNRETTFGIIYQPKMLPSLLNRDYVHETCWVCRVGAYFAVDFDEALHDDGFCFSSIERILETVIPRQYQTLVKT